MEVKEKELRSDRVKNVQPDKSTKACGVERESRICPDSVQHEVLATSSG